jgi:hypothetical protein
VEQLEAVDHQVFVLADGYGGAPFFPAPGAGAAVELGAQEADGDGFHMPILSDSSLSFEIVSGEAL